ncbi:protein tyrosine phosphatase 69D [Anticarsia gemmatalis]|uniref:protein tyrosine phosphatase 69D n=1 Tax=Anticarsia gemmatalis TaxID=129554 RepID=UPI003F75C851
MTMGRTVGNYLATLVLYFLCMGLWYPILAQEISNITLTISEAELGEEVNVTCTVEPSTAAIDWLFDGQPVVINDRINITAVEGESTIPDLDGGHKKIKISTMTISNVTSKESGNYTCNATLGDRMVTKSRILDLSFPGKLNSTNSPIWQNLTDHQNVTLMCIFEIYKPGEVRWSKKGNTPEEDSQLGVDPKPTPLDLRHVRSTYVISIQSHDDNGTYICETEDSVTGTNISGIVEVLVVAIPQVTIDRVIAINTTQLYVNWTVKPYNSKILNYTLAFRPLDGGFQYSVTKIPQENTSIVMSRDNLKPNTTYVVRLTVETEYGKSNPSISANVTTLAKEPIFVPNISINGFSATSVTIGWAPPPDDIADLIHYYELTARKKGDTENTFKTCHSRDSRNLPYMFGNLQPHSTYVFQVQACSDFTKTCGPLSEEMEAATLDGVPGKPDNVTATCDVDYLYLTWSPPITPNAEIKGYSMEITGNATYIDRNGNSNVATWGPLSKFMTNDSNSVSVTGTSKIAVRVTDLAPNTLYTVRVNAMTRTRRRGDEAVVHCRTNATHPDTPPRPRWRKILEGDKYMFKMYLPRISERNGPICCYRVYMVRLAPNADWKSLQQSPSDFNVVSYEEAHKTQESVAYIADIFSNENFPRDSELILGDGKVQFNVTEPKLSKSECRSRCLKRPKPRPPPPPPVVHTTSAATPPNENLLAADEEDGTEDPDEAVPLNRERRDATDDDRYSGFALDRTMLDKPEDTRDYVEVRDGPLDPNSNYTLFVELFSEAEPEPRYSDYTSLLMPAASPPVPVQSSALEIALQITCGVAGVVLVLMIAYCVLQTRRSRKMPAHAQYELNPISAAMRYWDSIRGRQPLVSVVPPDIPPIPKEGLPQAYAQRQVDSDYGFQKEFEMLPECFPDRTTHASEARENQPKNRYPDIKAYDQTRVKLSQIDSITGSDYINANYVMGYQERKQFICAQGPTDTTVNDFWRMIWEHGLELIVMLTNLEEYSKVKCSKYWPEERGARTFGSITVHHTGEKRYSDYIVRELKISKQATNSDGQPIVENNGIAKRNGDVKDGSECSAPTSPREVKDSADTRIVRQYHFLMWKDFAAPEHPHSILKFIKRVNEAWSNMVGRPVVVHCSAGVGRTGTLVALDCLLEQLRATGHVAVFNTVAELRRQRNFLVQSQKQYVFVYRALVEYAHHGDTEISASRLKPAVDRLRNTPEGADKCLMEFEFEKMVNSPVAEPLKSMGGGAGEELRARNRSPESLPYDRNRVILTPLPGRDYSTYINASFIEAYDNSESFIITQDPLPNTIMDFWRMVSEHNVTTIVMLSELGDGKCPRYWDDGTVAYEHISVEYQESESCPYYTRRQFRVTNDKSGDTCVVRQLQYQGWPTARGHVPEVTRGLAELADAAGATHAHDHNGTMLVHCQFGTERSPLFVALCTLIRALRVERRVDVSGVARAIRSQRARTIDTFLQYEFLYRAILNYAELHNLLEDS